LKTPLIWTIILAAGESKRMNKQKLLLKYGERSIIETVVQENQNSKVDEILVVLGSDHKRIKEKLNIFEIKTVHNEDYREGMLSSVKKGVGAVPSNVSAVLISLGDQPMIQCRVIDKLITAFTDKPKGIIIPVNKGQRGHPLLINKKYFREILDLTDEESLRTIIANHPDDILELEVNTGDILRDIDTKEQYENELNQRR
jgi:molybdenum cofactor cytidylyltransferase